MQEQLEQLKQAAVADYIRFSGGIDPNNPAQAERIKDFSDNFIFKKGKKYIKVISDRAAWGFIVTEDDGYFRKGDILKAASWSAPAKNSPRGNIIDGGYRVEWTGPLYLR